MPVRLEQCRDSLMVAFLETERRYVCDGYDGSINIDIGDFRSAYIPR